MKKYADANRTERSFQVGDFVYLKMQPLRETALGRQNAPKLSSKWYGPFKVLKTVGKSSYQLLLPDSAKIHDVFHVNQLKKHIGSHAISNDKLPLVTEDGKVKLAPPGRTPLSYSMHFQSSSLEDLPSEGGSVRTLQPTDYQRPG
jgi:hypothetical protein